MSDETRVTGQRRRTRSEIRQIVAQYADSGLNRSEFCRRHGICVGTLNRYLQQSSCTRNDGLVRVELTSGQIPTHGKGSLAVVLLGGRRIEVSAGFDAPTVERLVALLEKL